MIKKEFPILEFDPDQQAFIEPRVKSDVKVPNRMVVCFFKEVIAELLETKQIVPLTSLASEMPDVIIYKYVDYDCCIVQGLLGAPACAGFLEEFIALGVNKVMFCGGGGVLRSDLTLGRYVIIDSAVRDEGFSYHYLAPSREVKASPKVVQFIQNYLDEKEINYLVGKAWTTDAFYRETKEKIALRKEEGCIIVEMEQAGMLAVSQFRGIEYGAIIYGGDDLSKEFWDSRGWQSRTDIRRNLATLCRDIVLKM